ncbi:hypothetical protein [Roseibium aggregatum]|uniref:hypothetical protein n=1 Tax=Roseibium aggregatum TaxID=187304 RepID=UPI003A96D3F8
MLKSALNNIFVVSFYTANTPYEKEAKSLKKSFDRFNAPQLVEPLRPKGSWVENCALKANFVKGARQRLKSDIWWLDADAELCKPLTTFPNGKPDIAAYVTDGNNLRSGVVFFACNETVDLIVNYGGNIVKNTQTFLIKFFLDLLYIMCRAWKKVRFEILPGEYYKSLK